MLHVHWLAVRLPGELEAAVEPTYAAMIAYYLQSVADWRRRRAVEEQWELRHLQAAHRLDELVSFIRELPIDDPRFEVIGKLNQEGDVLVPGPIMANAVARFGFFDRDVTNDALLSRMAELAIEDRGQAGIDPLRDLPF
jgi:hypothetical protein